MPVKIVSDLHSALPALRREVMHEDTLLLLGDLVNIIDYLEMDGILVEVFGLDAVKRVVELRAQKRFDEARAVMTNIREGREGEVWQAFRQLQTDAYAKVRDSLPHKTYLISGNVDSPEMLDSLAGPGVELIDGKAIDLDGVRIGFAGGGLPTPLGVAGEISEEDYNAKLDAIGEVDVICSHIPPDLPELTFDTLARRRERGSAYLLEYVKQVQPIRVFFGHIHQPLVSSAHVGRTHLLNAGYFRRTKRAITLWV